MPVPKPNESEAKNDFISRFMSNEAMKKEFPDEKQRVAVANQKWRDSKKSKRESSFRGCGNGIKLREEDGEFYSEGFICTTHIDRAKENGCSGTAITKEVCKQIVDFINDGKVANLDVGSTRTVSYRHDWVKEGDPTMMPAGMALPPAEVRETDDGQFGVWCRTHHNKEHEKFDSIKYDIEHGYIPGYSIEFKEGDSFITNVGDQTIKIIKSISNFFGYAFATARMIANPNALIQGFGYREIEDIINKEDSKMSEEKTNKENIEQQKESQSLEEKKDEVIEQKEQEKVKEESVQEEKSEEEKEVETKELKIDVKEVVSQIRETKEYKEAIESLKPKSRTIKGENNMENITLKELKQAVEKNDMIAYRETCERYMDEQFEKGQDILQRAIENPKNYTVGFKSNLKVRTVGKGLRITNINIRGTLGTGDNTSSYTQSDVEFADVFAPGIIDTFNNQINLFGFLKKEQHIGGEYVQWKMVTNRDPDSNSSFVSNNDVAINKNYSSKSNYQTPLKIMRRGVSVTDFINRYSARSLGNLFQLEVDLQMKEGMKDTNIALFDEVADGAGNAPLGLEAVADSAGNTTLYGLTRSTANRLSPGTATDTYVAVGGNLTEAVIRTKLSYLETEGTRKSDIAIVTSPTGRDYLFNLLDGQRRFNTTEASFGFNRMNVPSYDGIPIIVDSDCTSTATASSGAAMYFIDTETDIIVIGMEPRLTDLAKVGAATEAYIQMDFAHVYKQPRRIGMLDTLSGP